MKTYESNTSIKKPLYNQIILFASNREGRHGKGMALFCKQNAGAIYGQAEGLQGQSYGVITKELRVNFLAVTKEEIINGLSKWYEFVEENPKFDHLIPYRGKNTYNLNGFSPLEMASMFIQGYLKSKLKIFPDNIVFEENFLDLIKYYLNS